MDNKILTRDRKRLESGLKDVLSELNRINDQRQAHVSDYPINFDLEPQLLHGISGPIIGLLDGEKIFKSELFIHSKNGSFSFNSEGAAKRLVRHLWNSKSPKLSIAWLEKVLVTKSADGLCVMLLHGFSALGSHDLTDNIKLIQIADLPVSIYKSLFQAQPHPMLTESMLNRFSASPLPTVALVIPATINPFISNATSDRPDPLPDIGDEFVRLEEVRNVLTLFGPSAPVKAVGWFQYSDGDLEASVGITSLSYSTLEVVQRFHLKLPEFEPAGAREIIESYLGLELKMRTKISIALKRLNQSQRRHSPGDQAIDIIIALESLIVGEKGELSYRISLRAALLVGVDSANRKRVRAYVRAAYKIRSDMVHKGLLKAKYKVGDGKISPLLIVTETTHICVEVIKNIILRGNYPDWDDVELA